MEPAAARTAFPPTRNHALFDRSGRVGSDSRDHRSPGHRPPHPGHVLWQGSRLAKTLRENDGSAIHPPQAHPVHARPLPPTSPHADLLIGRPHVQRTLRTDLREPGAGRQITSSPAKVQSALLEAMQSVSHDRDTCMRFPILRGLAPRTRSSTRDYALPERSRPIRDEAEGRLSDAGRGAAI